MIRRLQMMNDNNTGLHFSIDYKRRPMNNTGLAIHIEAIIKAMVLPIAHSQFTLLFSKNFAYTGLHNLYYIINLSALKNT
jgi:hypothetical protein